VQSDTAAQRRIGRYVLLDKLGRGAMGIVYRAQDPLINRTVAVKLLDIRQTLSSDQTKVVHERRRWPAVLLCRDGVRERTARRASFERNLRVQ